MTTSEIDEELYFYIERNVWRFVWKYTHNVIDRHGIDGSVGYTYNPITNSMFTGVRDCVDSRLEDYDFTNS